MAFPWQLIRILIYARLEAATKMSSVTSYSEIKITSSSKVASWLQKISASPYVTLTWLRQCDSIACKRTMQRSQRKEKSMACIRFHASFFPKSLAFVLPVKCLSSFFLPLRISSLISIFFERRSHKFVSSDNRIIHDWAHKFISELLLGKIEIYGIQLISLCFVNSAQIYWVLLNAWIVSDRWSNIRRARVFEPARFYWNCLVVAIISRRIEPISQPVIWFLPLSLSPEKRREYKSSHYRR